MTTDDPLTGKSDLQHLFDLLCLIPRPTTNDASSADFWQRIAATEGKFREAEVRPRGFGRSAKHEAETNRDQGAARYITSSLGSALHRVTAQPFDDCHPEHKRYLAQYVLMFFDGDRAALWEELSLTLDPGAGMPPGATGRRWCEDVCATAWRLWVATEGAGRREDRIKEIQGGEF